MKWPMLRWMIVTLGLALLQLWVLLLLRWLRVEPLGLESVLQDGILIFYANALAMSVLLDKTTLVKFLSEDDPEFAWHREREFVLGIALPLFVVVLSVTAYCALLTTSTPSNRIILAQVVTTILALVSSFSHFLLQWTRFRSPEESTER